mgnify:CR=1 FL=1
MQNYQTTFSVLNSENIPYEIRRNPINIYNFENIFFGAATLCYLGQLHV